METTNFLDISADYAPPAVNLKKANPWDPRLVMDLAIQVDDELTILERYNLSKGQLRQLLETPAFKRELAVAVRDVRNDGVTFKAKARVQAETYLEVLDGLVYDTETPAGVRLDAIKSAVKWGGLEPKDEKNEGGLGQSVNIQINF